MGAPHRWLIDKRRLTLGVKVSGDLQFIQVVFSATAWYTPSGRDEEPCRVQAPDAL